MPLGVREGVHRQDVGRGAVGHRDRPPVRVGQQHMPVVLRRRDGIRHFRAPVGHHRRRSHRDSLGRPQEVAQVGRLVVAAHLPGHRLAVLHVVQQGINAPPRFHRRRINPQGHVVVRAGDDFLAPVAQDVGLQGGRVLRPVVQLRAGSREDGRPRTELMHHGRAFRPVAVQGLRAEVAVPVNPEIVVNALRAAVQDFVRHGAEQPHAGCHGLASRILVGEVAGHRTPAVAPVMVHVVNLAGGGVTVVRPLRVLVAGENLLPLAVGVEVAAMLGVAVSQPRGGEPLAVVVDDHRAVDNLVPSVPVHIGNAIIVVSLPEPGAAPVAAVPTPPLRQLVGRRVDVVRDHLVPRIDAPRQEEARVPPVEVRRTEEELVGTVAGAVSPCRVDVRLPVFQTLQGELHRLAIKLGGGTLHI